MGGAAEDGALTAATTTAAAIPAIYSHCQKDISRLNADAVMVCLGRVDRLPREHNAIDFVCKGHPAQQLTASVTTATSHHVVRARKLSREAFAFRASARGALASFKCSKRIFRLPVDFKKIPSVSVADAGRGLLRSRSQYFSFSALLGHNTLLNHKSSR
jgi:hypothetical protein